MRFLASTLVLVFALTFGAQAQQTEEEFELEAVTFALNNATYVLYHEIGHMLIGELDIPVLGKEEDAADNLATLFLLVEESEAADQVLVDSSDGWFLSDVLNQSETYEDADFYGEHSLDVQRAFQLVCLMVGSNPDVFGDVATTAGLDEERQENCAFDYDQTLTSWDTVLAPHITDTVNDAIDIIYEDSADYSEVASLLKQAQTLENAAEYGLSGYALPRRVQMVSRECGEANAHYDPELGEIVLCYELLDMFYGMFYDGFGPDAEQEAAN